MCNNPNIKITMQNLNLKCASKCTYKCKSKSLSKIFRIL